MQGMKRKLKNSSFSNIIAMLVTGLTKSMTNRQADIKVCYKNNFFSK